MRVLGQFGVASSHDSMQTRTRTMLPGLASPAAWAAARVCGAGWPAPVSRLRRRFDHGLRVSELSPRSSRSRAMSAPSAVCPSGASFVFGATFTASDM